MQSCRLFCFTLCLGESIALAPAAPWSGPLPATIGPNAPLNPPITVAKRDLVSITVSGSIYTGCADGWHGPSGSEENGYRDFGYTCGVVMAKLAEHHVPIEGGARTFVAAHGGPLSLYVNDDNLANNQGTYTVTITTWPPTVADADEDGLDDALEDQLLDYYAPEFRFDDGEDHLPCEADWFLRNSGLESCGDREPRPERAPFYPEWFLATVSGCNANHFTSFLDTPFETSTRADIDNDRRTGQETERVQAARGLGLYGHVVRQGDVIVLQYWQLYGFSDIDVSGPDFGEHEGDWELVEVFVAAASPFDVSQMRMARWHAHGEDPAAAQWRAGEGWSWPEGHPNDPLPPMPTRHVPVFVERGSHGSWPTKWDYPFVSANSGNGIRYTPSSVANVGEVYRPRLGCETILHFNGRWGKWASATTTPAGPVLQRWIWPDLGPITQARYVGKWDHGTATPAGPVPRGKISWPHQTMADAAAANTATPGRIMLTYPGTYPGAVTISTPTELRAAYGPVTIGP